MRTRTLIVSSILTVTVLLLAGLPAQAEDTTTEFTLDSAVTFAISVPASTVDLGVLQTSGGLNLDQVTGDATFSSTAGDFGSVTVTDERSTLDHSWVVDVTATAPTVSATEATAAFELVEFLDASTATASASDPNTWIDGGDATYRFNNLEATVGSLLDLSGTEIVVATDGDLDGDGTTDASITHGVSVETSNSNEITWDPSFDVTIPATQVPGKYRGTVTHSLS